MNSTLIQGLNEKILQAKVNAIDVRPFQFPTYFPLRQVNAFNWKTLTNKNFGHNVAADIAADNASVGRKRRPIFQSASGDLPRLAISREMRRSEIKDYQVALALAGDIYARELVQYWADDVEYCFTGVQAELEYIAWALLSGGGKLAFTPTNNAYMATEFSLDYEVEDAQLIKNSVSWATPASGDGIGDFRKAIEEGKKINSSIRHAFMALSTFYKYASLEQIIKACASYLDNATGTAQTPDLESVNKMLKKQAWLNGIQIHVVDIDVTRELSDGTQTMGNPFADNIVVFSEVPVLGSTQYGLLKDSAQNVMRSERKHTVVKKYSEPEPLKEVTIGEADALPVLDTAYKNIYMNVAATSW